jgi:multisubunit Na+/H+ antiporter MnhB subunit
MIVADVFDIALVAILLACAWLALTTASLQRAVVLFIAFGLLAALAWVRLQAPDVALAEAAVGSGLTGALLLSASIAMQRTEARRKQASAPVIAKEERREDGTTEDDTTMTPLRSILLALTMLLVAGLVLATLSFPPDNARLAPLVIESLPQSGVLNPVTAVLLNYRGYDTLLEVVVLLLAIVGIWTIAPQARVWIRRPDTPVLAVFVRLLLPLMVVVAGYLLWLGTDEPGGAFQGGAVLGAMGVMWVAAAVWLPNVRRNNLLRPLLGIGVAAFITAAVVLLLANGSLLKYPPDQAKTIILIIESAAMFSIGATLTLLFVGGFPHRRLPTQEGEQ